MQQSRIESYLDDSTVTAKIKAELIKDAGMRGLDISVKTHEGQVILSGFVETQQQSRRAMQIASGIRGVVAVKNGLVIKT
jgi:hyperosmotically inducible protein